MAVPLKQTRSVAVDTTIIIISTTDTRDHRKGGVVVVVVVAPETIRRSPVNWKAGTTQPINSIWP